MYISPRSPKRHSAVEPGSSSPLSRRLLAGIVAMFSLILPGSLLRFEYPVHNRFDLPLEYRPRTVRVASIRKVGREPLSVVSVLKRPLIRRGSILIRGVDLDCGELRQFYLEAMRGLALETPLPQFRLGLFDPLAPEELVDWIGRPFDATEYDRLVMRRTIEKFNAWAQSDPDVALCLAAYPVEDEQWQLRSAS